MCLANCMRFFQIQCLSCAIPAYPALLELMGQGQGQECTWHSCVHLKLAWHFFFIVLISMGFELRIHWFHLFPLGPTLIAVRVGLCRMLRNGSWSGASVVQRLTAKLPEKEAAGSSFSSVLYGCFRITCASWPEGSTADTKASKYFPTIFLKN